MQAEAKGTTAPAERPRIIVDYGNMVRLRGLTDRETAEIKKELTLTNPKWAQARRFAKFGGGKGLDQFYYGYQMIPGGMLIARGAFHQMLCNRFAHTDVQFNEEAFQPPRFFCKMPLLDAHLRDYQARLVQQVTARCGTIVGICGSGKTEMALSVIHQRNVPALILVDQLDIMDQWYERILLRTSVKAVRLGGSKKKLPEVTDPYCIATVQTLWRNPGLIRELDKTRELVAIDECQTVPARSFTDVLSLMNPFYLFGCTATPERSDGLTKMITWYCGPVIATVDRSELEATGVTMKPELIIHETPFRGDYDPEKAGEYGKVLDELVENGDRLEVVVSRIEKSVYSYPDSYHLVVSGRRAYGKVIAETLGNLGISCALITGADSKLYRRKTIAAAREGQFRVIIAPKLADKALDLPILTDVHLVFPQRSKGPLEQRIGRVCRSREGKSGARVHDYVDGGRLLRQFKHRFWSVYNRICSVDQPTEMLARKLIKAAR